MLTWPKCLIQSLCSTFHHLPGHIRTALILLFRCIKSPVLRYLYVYKWRRHSNSAKQKLVLGPASRVIPHRHTDFPPPSPTLSPSVPTSVLQRKHPLVLLHAPLVSLLLSSLSLVPFTLCLCVRYNHKHAYTHIYQFPWHFSAVVQISLSLHPYSPLMISKKRPKEKKKIFR